MKPIVAQNSKQYPLVDVIKFICSLMVASLHVIMISPICKNSKFDEYLEYGLLNYLFRIAVPFFFAASGFFLFQKIDFQSFDLSVTKNHVFKLLRLLGVWSILLFAGWTGHLWYIGGLVVATCILTVLLYKKVPLSRMVILASILFLFGLLGDPYYGLLRPLFNSRIIGFLINGYYKVFSTTRNGVFMGFPFLLLGGVIEKKRFSMKPAYAFLGFSISMAALLCEVVIVKKLELMKDPSFIDMYICLVPAIFFLLVFAVNASNKTRKIYVTLRNVSVIVYFSHLLVNQLVLWGLSFIGLPENTLCVWSLTITLSVAFGFAVDRLSRTEKLSFMKYLYR